MKIALVDDEKNVRLAIRTALKQEGFDTVEFANGQEAFDSCGGHTPRRLHRDNGMFPTAIPCENERSASGLVHCADREIPPDLYILDIMMPVMDGITLLRKLREKGISTPVMFLTSKDEEFDKVLGLELGADDYLCKPFSIRELIARVHVILRRYKATSQTPFASKTIEAGPITLNELSHTATLGGQPLSLTVTEFRILYAFINHAGEALSRDRLIQASYPDETYLNDRAIDCHIKRLRKKLSGCARTRDCIETVYGLGYRFLLNPKT